jgi:hypothetical protein
VSAAAALRDELAKSGGLASLPHGIHPGISESEYHAKGGPLLVSNSLLGKVLRSPAHARAWLDATEDEDTPAMAFGRALHRAILEPHLYQPFPSSTKKGREDNEAIAGMVAKVRAHPLAGRMLAGGLAELTVRWAVETVECKARLDYYVEPLGLVVDIKSTTDASPEAFRKSIANYEYHRQAAFYRFGLERLGKPCNAFVFLAIEKAAPYECALYALDESAMSRGRERASLGLMALRGAHDRQAWAGYPDSIQELSLPPWA